MATTQHESHACTFPGCDRAFKRHEHLLRHAKSHNPAISFTCSVCGKEFNRKDSLARHLALHKDQPSDELPKKVKRACEPCRKAKTKCDGETSCKSCAKKGLECIYVEDEGQDDVMMRDGILVPSELESAESDPIHFPQDTFEARLSPPGTNEVPDAMLAYDPAPASQPEVVPFTTEAPESSKTIDWKAVVVRQDPVDAPAYAALPELTDVGKDAYLDAFFERVHHHWPIVHRVTEVDSTDYPQLLSSVRMVGAWVEGSEYGRKHAVDTYEQLWTDCLQKFNSVTASERFQQTLSAGTCHSALLCVILGFYRGETTTLTESRTLLSAMVTALRHTGFFQDDVLYRDQQVQVFLPLKMVLLGQRQRLASSLYKIDAYLSLVQNQPANLYPEDLHFTLQTTFTFYNSFGLDDWDERRLLEPAYRNQTTMLEMVQRSLSKDEAIVLEPILVEDFQIALCALWLPIWRLNKSKGSILTEPRDSQLKEQLEVVRARLQRVGNSQVGGSAAYDDLLYPAFKYYLGINELNNVELQSHAGTRFRTLLMAALLLYQTLALETIADIQSFSQLAKDHQMSNINEPFDKKKEAQRHRNDAVKEWSKTSLARDALCRSVDILAVYESARSNIEIHRFLDPITHVSLVFASLVIWAYCIHGAGGCQFCIPHPQDQSVELTNWSNLGLGASEAHRDAWIEVGCHFRPQIHGLQLCSCNIGFFVGLFKKHIPLGSDIGVMVFGEIWTELM